MIGYILSPSEIFQYPFGCNLDHGTGWMHVKRLKSHGVTIESKVLQCAWIAMGTPWFRPLYLCTRDDGGKGLTGRPCGTTREYGSNDPFCNKDFKVVRAVWIVDLGPNSYAFVVWDRLNLESRFDLSLWSNSARANQDEVRPMPRAFFWWSVDSSYFLRAMGNSVRGCGRKQGCNNVAL